MESAAAPSPALKRPAGVTLLTALLLVGGLGVLVTGFLTDARRERMAAAFEPAGFAAITVYGGVVALAAVTLAAGIGFVRRKAWGWWLGTFYFAYGLAQNAIAAAAAYGLGDAAEPGDGEATALVLTFGARALAHGLIYLYLFRERVRSWFAAATVPVLGVVAADAGVCAAIYVAGWVVNG